MLEGTKSRSMESKIQALEQIFKPREDVNPSEKQAEKDLHSSSNLQVRSSRMRRKQTPKKIIKEEEPEAQTEVLIKELKLAVEARTKRVGPSAMEPAENSQNENASPRKPARSVFSSPSKKGPVTSSTKRPETPLKLIPLNNNLVFNTNSQTIEQIPIKTSVAPKEAELPQEQHKPVENLEKKGTPGKATQAPKNTKAGGSKIEAPKATQSYNYLIWSGFVTALGVAAVALAFTVLNAATGGTAGLAVLGIGLATLLAGAGLFAQGYRTRAKVEPQVEPGVEMASARV